MKGPAYRVVTDRLVVRCWAPSDAPLLETAIDESLEHLRPSMPWAASEPEPIEAKVARLRAWRAAFDTDKDHFYGVFSSDESRVLGGTGLHVRANGSAREIGYWIHAGHVRQGLATEIAGALTRVAFEVDGVERIEISCALGNLASAGVPRRLGYTHETTLRPEPPHADAAPEAMMLWRMLTSEFAGSVASRALLEAYDARGGRLVKRSG